MKFEDLLEWVQAEPVFDTGLLLAGDVDRRDVRKQLSRWVGSGKVQQLRRGLYALAPPYRKVTPHPFLVANRLVPASYISLQAGLAHFGLIPEAVPIVTSVTTSRPALLATPLGVFSYRHVQVDWFHTYAREDLGNNQSAFVATPAKALLDLVYLEPGADNPDYLRALRLQFLERLNLDDIQKLAERSSKPKLKRAAAGLRALQAEARGYEAL
jgi:predicted transcriptional regulator of viral defense system